MDKSKGWVCIWRCLQDNPLWTSEPFTRGQAWVDLIIIANHKRTFFYKRNVKVVVERGQVGRSEVELADRWKWSRTKLRKFLNDLEKEQQIIQHKSTVTQILTIIKYEEYQQKEQQDIQQQDSSETAKEQQQDTYNNDNNANNVNKKEIDEPAQEKKTKKEKTNGTKLNTDILRPEWFSLPDWQDAMIHREKKKTVKTERAVVMFVANVEECTKAGYTVKQCIDAMSDRNWQTVKLEWMQNSKLFPAPTKTDIRIMRCADCKWLKGACDKKGKTEKSTMRDCDLFVRKNENTAEQAR